MAENSSKGLNISRFTREVFFTTFPTALEEDYENSLGQDSVDVIREYETEQNIHIETVRYVMIDEEYIDWLRVHFRRNTGESRIEYMESLSDQEVERLWEKHNEGHYIESLILPVVLFSHQEISSSSLPLPQNLTDELQALIAQTLHISLSRIMIHPELVRLDYYFHEFMPFFDAFSYHALVDSESEVPPVPPSFFIQEYAQSTIRAVPIAIHSTQNAIIHLREPCRIDFDRYAFNEKNILKWFKTLQKTCFTNYFIDPHFYLVYGEDIPIFYGDVMSYMEEANEED